MSTLHKLSAFGCQLSAILKSNFKLQTSNTKPNHLLLTTILLLTTNYLSLTTSHAQLKVTTVNQANPTPPQSCAILELESNDRGLLLPRLANNTAITAPLVKGLLIYNTAKDSVQFYNGTKWISL